MPLSFFKSGESARVMHVGGADATRKHLGSLGFSAGTVVRVIEDTEGGKIVGVHESRLALNDELARRIECAAVGA
jgi:ferrous iron transport protein A